MDWQAIQLTLQLASTTTAILFVFGLPFSYWLARSKWRGRFLIESLVTLPLVLPPTVLGFYLLVALGPHGFIGRGYHQLTGSFAADNATGGMLPFSFPGIVIGSVLCNVPFAVRPFIAAFANMDRRLEEAAWCLGVSRWKTFWRVTLPLCWPGILAGLVLTFAHAIGEFGVVLMLGGNIPGITRTLSISIYDDVQALDYVAAGQTSLWLVVFSFAVLCLTHTLGGRGEPK